MISMEHQWNPITLDDLIICSKAAIFPDLGQWPGIRHLLALTPSLVSPKNSVGGIK